MSSIVDARELFGKVLQELKKITFADVKLHGNFGLVKFYSGTPLNTDDRADVDFCDEVLRRNLYHLSTMIKDVRLCVINFTQFGIFNLDLNHTILEIDNDKLMSVVMLRELVKVDASNFGKVLEIFSTLGNEDIKTILTKHCLKASGPSAKNRRAPDTPGVNSPPRAAPEAASAPAQLPRTRLNMMPEWNCSDCSYKNQGQDLACTICTAPRPAGDFEVRASLGQNLVRSAGNTPLASASAEGHWDCVHCTYKNHSSIKICSMCSKSKDGGLAFMPDALPLAHGSGGRATKTCTECTTINDVDNVECVTCESPFPILDESYESASSEEDVSAVPRGIFGNRHLHNQFTVYQYSRFGK